MPERRAMPEIFGVDGPRTASVCQNEVVQISREGDRPWNKLFE